MSLSEAKNAHYRTLAEFEQVVLPQYMRLENVDWQLVRRLILKYWRRQNAHYIRHKFNEQQGAAYMSGQHLVSRWHDKQRGGYPSRFVYLSHQFQPAWGWCPLALDQTRRVPAGTIRSGQHDERALAEAETHWQYNNPFVRPFKLSDYHNGQLIEAWGREEMEAAWQQRAPNARAFIAEQLNAVAWLLRRDKGLAILLETGAPRLTQLSGEKQLLGYVAYFLDCWQRFHEYEQAAPVATALADAGATSDNLSQRQAAIFYYYTQQPITENNVADLAAAKGHKSKTSGKQLLEKYAAWCELQESELPDSTRELGALQTDLECVRPQLTGEAAADADAYLKRVIEKKKRGL